MNLQELIEARANKLAEMKALNEANPTMDETVQAKYDALHDEFKALNRKVEIAKTENKLSNEVDDVIAPSGADKATNNSEYLKNFLNLMAGINVEEAKANMTEGVDADGGYTVPIEFQKQVIKKLSTMSATRSISSVISTKNDRKIPIMGSTPVFTWIDETGLYGETKATFGQETLGAYKLGAIIPISKELQFDTMIDMQNYLQGLMVKGIDKYESIAFATGDGLSKPTGYTVSAPTGTHSTTAATNAVTADELIDIYYDLPEEYRKNATWRMTSSTEKAIRKLKNSNGDYIYGAALNSAERPTLLSRPIVIDENMAELGTGNTFAVFGDFSFYQIANRGAMSVERIANYDVKKDLDALKVHIRVDAKVLLQEAFNAAKNA